MVDAPLDIQNPAALPGRGMRDLLRTFTAISRALNLAQPLPETLDLISEKVSRAMGHKSCAVLLANRETDELLIEGSFGLGDDYVRALNTRLKQKIAGSGPESRSVTAQAFRTAMPVYAPDITEDPRFAPWREAALEEGYNSIVALPLIFRDEVIGVLNCYDAPREYTEDQVEALMVVAEQAASAVGIARLISSQRSTIEQLNALNEHATAQHTLMQRSEKTHETLAALLLEGRSLDDITNALATLLDAPVVLQDEKLGLLSSSHADDYPGLAPGAHDLSDLDATGRAGSLGSASDGRLLLAVPVDLGGRGYLSASFRRDVERTFALRTLEQAAVTFALYAARQRSRREAEDRVRGDLLADLLAGRFRGGDEARERARHLGVDLSRTPLGVLVVRHEPPDVYLDRGNLNARGAGPLRSRLLSVARGFAEGAHPPGLAGSDGDHLVVLLPEPPEDARGQAERLIRLLREDFSDLRLRAVVGAPAPGPADLASRYGEARSLLDLSERLGAGKEVLLYRDWELYGLVLRGGDRTGLLELAHRALDPVLAQGADASRDLLATLQAYLENDLSPTRTAEVLYVHPNTVKYRMGKISDLSSLVPSNLDDVLTLKISLMIRSLDPENFDTTARPPS